MFLKISQENICVGVSILIKLLACNFIKRDSNKDVFLWNLQHFQEHLFLQNTSSGCFWKIYLDRSAEKGQRFTSSAGSECLQLYSKNLVWFGFPSYFNKGDQTETVYITKSTSLHYFAKTCYWRCSFSHWH